MESMISWENGDSRLSPFFIRLLVAAAFAVMHISWGAGFISRLFKLLLLKLHAPLDIIFLDNHA
jgi:hypothetical protein